MWSLSQTQPSLRCNALSPWCSSGQNESIGIRGPSQNDRRQEKGHGKEDRKEGVRTNHALRDDMLVLLAFRGRSVLPSTPETESRHESSLRQR